MLIRENTVQQINAALLAIQKEIEALIKRVEELEKTNNTEENN